MLCCAGCAVLCCAVLCGAVCRLCCAVLCCVQAVLCGVQAVLCCVQAVLCCAVLCAGCLQESDYLSTASNQEVCLCFLWGIPLCCCCLLWLMSCADLQGCAQGCPVLEAVFECVRLCELGESPLTGCKCMLGSSAPPGHTELALGLPALPGSRCEHCIVCPSTCATMPCLCAPAASHCISLCAPVCLHCWPSLALST